MDWKRLLSNKRLGKTGSVTSDVRSEFQRDFDRIVFSSAFRRLQDKTQVFPLAASDYVRTRLTHSVEVSSVGRSLGTLAGEKVVSKGQVSGVPPQMFGSIVAAACLAHDIGNPPFGHSGEDAIQTWFRNPRSSRYLEGLEDAQQQDLTRFEGNAQGFRILTRLQNVQNPGGLQLTFAVLGAFTKYPRQSYVPSMVGSKKVSEKKFGFYQSEKQLFENVAEELGLKKKTDGAWARHPLSFLMEAADDICYRIIDFEDGCRLGHVPFSYGERLLRAIAFPKPDDEELSSYSAISDFKGKIEYLRALAINNLIYAAVEVFSQNMDAIAAGDFEEDLVPQTSFSSQLKEIKDLSEKLVYAVRTVTEIEAAGFEVFGGLLERIVPALTAELNERSAHHKKVLQLIPEQFKIGITQYEKLLCATDFISGMTDSYAVTLYRRLLGIELPQG